MCLCVGHVTLVPLCAILPPSFDWLGWVVGCLCFSVCPVSACCFVVVVVESSGGSEVLPTWECGGEGGLIHSGFATPVFVSSRSCEHSPLAAGNSCWLDVIVCVG